MQGFKKYLAGASFSLELLLVLARSFFSCKILARVHVLSCKEKCFSCKILTIKMQVKGLFMRPSRTYPPIKKNDDEEEGVRRERERERKRSRARDEETNLLLCV